MKKSRKSGTRTLQLESLENREMLAVSILSAPVAAYAQTDNPAQIRLDLSVNGEQSGDTAQLEFVVKQSTGNSVDPSKITILDSTNKAVALSSVVDNAASSRASASLKSGVYTVLIYADSGKGNLTLDVLQNLDTAPKTGLETLIAAAITQQNSPSNWSGRAAYYNSLLAGTAYAGAASALPIYKTYPEVDINGDGKVNAADLALIQQQTTPPVKANVKSFKVLEQDLTAPSISIDLQNGSTTENPVIAGRITDASGIKSASYQRDGGAWVPLVPDAQGNYTIQNTNLAEGQHTVLLKVTDTKGNTATSQPFQFIVTQKDNPSVLTAKQTAFSGIVSNDLLNPKKLIDPGFSVSDPDAKDKTGFVYSYSNVQDGSAAAGNGLITDFNAANGTFSVDTSKLSDRNAESTVKLIVSVKSVSGGVVSKTITVKLVPVAVPSAPALTLAATEKDGVSGNVQPVSAGKTFSIGGLTLIEGTLPDGLTATDVASINAQGKFLFTPKESLQKLSEGEILKLKFRYTITDTVYGLTGSGFINVNITGKNSVPVFNLDSFVWHSSENSAEDFLDLLPYICDADADSEIFVTKINGNTVTKNVPVVLPSGASLTYLGGLKVRYQSNGKFKTLSEGDIVRESISLTVSDGTAECSAALNMEITGKHTPAQLLSSPEVMLPPLNLNELVNGFIDDQIQVAKDSGDSLQFSVSAVDSQKKSYSGIFRYENGALFLNPSGYDSLDLNETYTVTVNVENADSAYADTPLCVVYTLNFISRGRPVAAGNTLTLSENTVSGSVDLAAADTVNGKPLREQSGYSYSIILEKSDSEIPLKEGTDYIIVGGVFTFKTNGKFNTLGASEKAVFNFRYKITDTAQGSGIYTAEGILCVTVTGENNAPVLTASHNTFHTTNSNASANTVISAGVSFTVSDPDSSDKPGLSVGTVTGMKDGLMLQKAPAFTLDSSGHLTFTNKDIPELLPGESATFSVEIIATDIAGATDSKTVNIVIHAKKQPEVTVNLSDGSIVESDEAVSKRFAVSVSDTPELFLAQRSGNAWYSEPAVSVSIPEEYQFVFPNFSQLFSIKGNAADGYSVAFDAPAGYFGLLQEGETFDVRVQLTVADSVFNVTRTETFTISVTGKGSPHTIETAVPSFDYPANKRIREPAMFDPRYTIHDADRNDSYEFSLQKVAVPKLPNGVSAETLTSLLTFNADGTFTLDETGLDGITENFSYNITVRITSNSDGFEQDVPLTLNVKFAGAPIAEDAELSTDEDTAAEKTLSPTVPNDGMIRSTDWYSIGTPVYAGFFGTVPNGFDVAAAARSIISVSGNTFTLQPENQFDFLPKGTSIKLFYSYTVRDNVFATETSKTITVTINGVDDAPEFPAEQNFTVNVDDKKDMDSIVVGNIVFNDADTPLDQYKFQITNDSTEEFRFSRTEPTSVYFVYYADLFQAGQFYTFNVTATLKSNPNVSFQTTVTVTVGIPIDAAALVVPEESNDTVLRTKKTR